MANIAQIRAQSIAFQKVRNIQDLGKLLGESPNNLNLLALKPQYHVFEIPKKNGKKRIIEAPEESLKKVLQKINDYLQAVYYALRPSAVYGFCISHANEEDRNIVSNAKRHIGKKYLLNIDFQDFFHDISFDKVYHIFAQHFPKQKPELTRLLAMLCCFRERLPMGSPTSPVLSNFACLHFDAEMTEYCKFSGITYTRFADDLSFSADIPIRKSDECFFRELIAHYGFRVNEEKVAYFEEGAEKTVTGIVVGETELSLPSPYLAQLGNEIERYKQVMIAESRYQTGMSHKKLALFKQELQGKWNFAQMVMQDAEPIVQLKLALDEALNPREEYESENWLDLPYNMF